MKRTVCLLLLLALALSLFACSGETGITADPAGPGETAAGNSSAPASLFHGTDETPVAVTGLSGFFYGEKECEDYTAGYTLILNENRNGTLVRKWTDRGIDFRYEYTVTDGGSNLLRMKGKECYRDGERVDLADYVEFSTPVSFTASGALILGAARDYDTVNYDLDDVFPVTLTQFDPSSSIETN